MKKGLTLVLLLLSILLVGCNNYFGNTKTRENTGELQSMQITGGDILGGDLLTGDTENGSETGNIEVIDEDRGSNENHKSISCGYIKKENGNVFCKYNKKWYGATVEDGVSIDFGTLKILSCNKEERGSVFLSDKNDIYSLEFYFGEMTDDTCSIYIVTGVNLGTFEIVGRIIGGSDFDSDTIAKDKNKIYNSYIGGIDISNNIDVNSYTHISGNYYEDKNMIYYLTDIVGYIDGDKEIPCPMSSMESIKTNCSNHPLDRFDYTSFIVSCSNGIKCLLDNIIVASKDGFEVLSANLAVNKYNLYFYGKQAIDPEYMKNISLETVYQIGQEFGKGIYLSDGKKVFYVSNNGRSTHINQLEGADAKTFKTEIVFQECKLEDCPTSGWNVMKARDKNGSYDGRRKEE